MQSIITRDLSVMHGEPCFAGTRVTLQNFFDHIEAGYKIDGFREQFPTVTREQLHGLLDLLRQDAGRVAVFA